jgi:hypothetical protein
VSGWPLHHLVFGDVMGHEILLVGHIAAAVFTAFQTTFNQVSFHSEQKYHQSVLLL